MRNSVAGSSVWGQGAGDTQFIFPPDENYSLCTGITSVGNVGCTFTGISGGGNFTITGMGHCQTGSHGVALFAPDGSANFWENVTLANYGCFDAASLGFVVPFSNKFSGMYNSGFGGTACELIGVNVILEASYCGETRQSPIIISGSGTVARTVNTYVGATPSTIGVWVKPSTIWTSVHDQSYGNVGSGGTHIYIDSGAIAYLNSWYNASGSSYGVQLTATGKLFLRDSSPINGTTHAIGTNAVTLTTGGFFDLGGNQYTGAANESTVIPTCAESAGNGTCAVTAGSTNERGTVRITAGTTTLLNPSFTLTFAGTFSFNGNTPSCTFNLSNTGTGSWTTAAPSAVGLPNPSAISTTATTVGITTTVNTVSTSTYDVNYGCVAR